MANILLIETSTKACSVALSRDFSIEFYEVDHEGPNHASILGVYVEKAMNYAREHDIEIDAVAVSSGPGSYTGLRIGVSEAKGLCFGLRKPLIAINTLQTLCCQVMFSMAEMPEDILFCPMIDARRMEVYTALYDLALNEVRPIAAEIIDENFVADQLEQRPILFFGDGSEKCQELIKHPNAKFIPGVRATAKDMLALAVKAYNEGKFEDMAYFVPFYLKDFVATKSKNPLESVQS